MKDKEEPREKNSKDEFVVPQSFVKQLDELSSRGYVLISISSKGRPIVHIEFEDEIASIALCTAGISFLKEVKRQMDFTNVFDDDSSDDKEEE